MLSLGLSAPELAVRSRSSGFSLQVGAVPWWAQLENFSLLEQLVLSTSPQGGTTQALNDFNTINAAGGVR